jgi:Protein of unknown function (DUF2585)
MPDRSRTHSVEHRYALSWHRALPRLAMLFLFAATAFQLHHQGRRWWCACGQPFLWTSEAWGPHTSQHLFDPYSFTHVLHGIAFCGLFAWALSRVSISWRLWLSLLLASLWEIAENSAFVIERYRAATAAVGYEGDSVANSLGDIVSCGVGFVIARRLGFRWSVVLFLVTEVVLLIWIRDDLLLNIVMLIYPLPQIRAWQMGN